MSPLLELTPDELLATTRAVRRRLDLERPVERALLEECLALAQQAPNANDEEPWRFVVITDPALRADIAQLYREGWDRYEREEGNAHTRVRDDPIERARWERQIASARYLLDHLHEVPVHVIPCVTPRTDTAPIVFQSAVWASIVPAAWSFMLAARARGLGTCWTSGHLFVEREVAELLGIPFATVMQAGLIPVAHTQGTEFRPARRGPVETITHWERWRG